jgi:hypothetical protein
MFPYRDDNVTIRTPIVTLLLIAANVAAWVLIQGAGSPLRLAESVCDLGLVAGFVRGKLFARPDYVEEHRAGHWAPRRLGWSR